MTTTAVKLKKCHYIIFQTDVARIVALIKDGRSQRYVSDTLGTG